MTIPYRLGIDIGTNSLGWCLLCLNEQKEPYDILDIGVRIFKDARNPKDKASLAAERRAARAMRRQRDRRLGRKHALMTALVEHGFMPSDPEKRKALEKLDPYKLRSEGLNRLLTPQEFGRVLFHLGQRRGFRSNLKADRKAKNGVTKEAQQKLADALGDEYATLGDFLYRKGVAKVERKLNGRSLGVQIARRFRPHVQGTKIDYDLYPTRALYFAEFDELWGRQADFRKEQTGTETPLTDCARIAIEKVIFDQRALKPVPIGKCTLEPDDPGRRAPEALPIAQRFRILQELNNLEWIDRDRNSHRLGSTERTKILKLLERPKNKKGVSFEEMRKIIGSSDVRFNLESKKRTKLDGDKVAYEMAHKKRFGDVWWKLTLEEQNAIVERILRIESEAEEKIFVADAKSQWGLTAEQARAVLEAPLPDKHYRLGRIAIRKLLPHLEQGKRYHEAAAAEKYDHAKLPDGELFDELPYYGERLINYTAEIPSASDPTERQFGRLANPTVHVALNQVRRVINDLINRYGHPEEIVIELARELPLGKEDLSKRENEQKKNQERNEEMRGSIEKLLREAGASESEIRAALARGDAVLRMRLWKELGKAPDTRCPYTGAQIGIRKLFSNEVHIDHILPFTRTHDDSYANKIVCLRRANVIKKNLTPWEAFHTNPNGYSWADILLRSENLPKNKCWRFAENAMTLFRRLDRFGIPKELADQFSEENSFLARHLIDTQYIARVTREYLTMICDPYRVWPITGGTTAMLRGKWNLSELLPTHNREAGHDKPARKSRLDHRHHAIDAFVVACTSRSMLKRIADAADDQRSRLIETMPDPWPGFDRNKLRTKLSQLIVSFRTDHGSSGIDPRTGRARTTGAFHNDTAYFPISEPDKHGRSEVVSRESIASFETMDDVEAICDLALRQMLKGYIQSKLAPEIKLKDICAAFSNETGIRKAKTRKRLKIIPIRDRTGRAYKAYKGDSNDYMELWRLPNGRWIGQIVSTFEANQIDGQRKRPHPAAKLLTRLYNDDTVRLLDEKSEERTLRIVKMSGQKVTMADHFEAGALKHRDSDKNDPFEYFEKSVSALQSLQFRKLHVSPSGVVRDPGPLE